MRSYALILSVQSFGPNFLVCGREAKRAIYRGGRSELRSLMLRPWSGQVPKH